MVGPIRDRCFQRQRFFFYVSRHGVRNLADTNHAGTDAVPCVFAFPCAIHDRFGAGDVIGGPVVNDRRDARLGRVLRHVGRLTKGDHVARFLRRRLRCCGIGVLQDNIRTLFDQNLGGVCFFGGVKPCVGPDDLELDIGVHLLGVDIGRVDAPDHFGDREGPDIADDVRFGHLARDVTLNGATFVETRGIGRHVVGTLVAGGVFEFHIREFARDVDGRVHIAKRRGKDQVRAVQRHLRHHTLGIGALGHVFNKDGFDSVAEFFLDRETALVVFIGPAAIADGANKDKTDFGLVLGICAARKPKRQCRAGHKCGEFHNVVP